ncbi:MAG: hypothetical protein Q7T03_00035, partial [Deltaproteobacteria bacterium]|nr:hypothetical protein [Deltaproteobacteria bacterium]
KHIRFLRRLVGYGNASALNMLDYLASQQNELAKRVIATCSAGPFILMAGVSPSRTEPLEILADYGNSEAIAYFLNQNNVF